MFKELLQTNDFVSLTGLGSFVKSYESAKLSPDGKTFFPPSQKVNFDISRTFNDEALAHFLEQKRNLSTSAAAEVVNIFISDVEQQLNSGKVVSFDNLGSLKKNDQGVLVFTQVHEDSLASDTFGLVSIIIPKEKEVKQQSISLGSAKKSSQKTPNSKMVVFGISAAILIIVAFSSLLFLLIPDLRFWTSKTEKPIVQTTTKLEESPVSEDVKIANAPADSSQATTQADHIVKSVDIKTDKKQALFYEEPKTQDNKTYYIISGSFTNIENAQKHFSKMQSKGYNPEIIMGNGNYRVSMIKFTERNRALNELERIRLQCPNESYWLLGL